MRQTRKVTERMSDNDNKTGKPLGLRGGGGDRSHVRQSFSHGRTKSVVVETKRKRVVVPKPGAATVTSKPGTSSAKPSESKRPAGITDAEMERRLILGTLRKTGGNKTEASKILGVTARTLSNKLRLYRERGELPGAVGV